VAPNGNEDDIAAREPLKALSIDGIRRVVTGTATRSGSPLATPRLARAPAESIDARHVPLQDIRLVLRHDSLDATQAYLAENPRRTRRRLRAFALNLDAGE
jgi:hypothetical protein